jgi:hypothetical protein
MSAAPPEWGSGAFFHGTSGLVFAYLLVTGAIIWGCVVARAAFTRYLAAPLVAIVVLLISMVVIGLLSFVLPHAWQFVGGMAVYVGFGFSYGRWGAPLGGGPKHHRGALVEPSADALSPRNQRPLANGQLTLAGVPVPLLDETKHFKLIGTTGTGKSTAIRELLTGALGRGDRAVVADPDGGYFSRFYDPTRGDVILNPFDERSRKWDLFAEIRNPYDFEQLARSLIPDGVGDDRIWQQYGQTFLAAVLRQAYGLGIRDGAELYRLLVSAPLEELRLLLEGTAAQPFLAAGNDRMFGSTRSVTMTAVSALRYIVSQQGTLLSIREWIQQGRGVLFLPYQADQIAALRAMISTWMRIAIFETMTLPEGDARLWFVVDELDALGQIDGLKDALARLRKFGGRCVLGFQSIAQVSGTYGRGEAETIVENCGNTLILRCSASEGGGTARFASKLIGEREIIREQVSKSRRPEDWLSTKTTSEQHVTESAVLASEIEQLPDLHGYLKFSSANSWARIILPVPPKERRIEGI